MSALAEARDALVEALNGLSGATVYGYVPEAIAAPAAVVQPSDPYLASGEEGVPFGWYRIRHKVTLVADVATNEVVTDALDAMIEGAVTELLVAGLAVETVSEPYVFQANENLHLAADLSVSNTIEF